MPQSQWRRVTKKWLEMKLHGSLGHMAEFEEDDKILNSCFSAFCPHSDFVLRTATPIVWTVKTGFWKSYLLNTCSNRHSWHYFNAFLFSSWVDVPHSWVFLRDIIFAILVADLLALTKCTMIAIVHTCCFSCSLDTVTELLQWYSLTWHMHYSSFTTVLCVFVGEIPEYEI